MTKEERDAVQARCISIDNIIISIERELRMLRTHLDILTKAYKTEPTISKMEQVEDEPQTSCKTCRFGEVDEGYVRCAYYSKATEQDEPQTDNGIGCSKCVSRHWCMDRDMPHAVHCNSYGKEPQTERSE